MRDPRGRLGNKELAVVPGVRRPFGAGVTLLGFNLGFVDQHYGDVVPDGIYAVALGALQSLIPGRKLQRGFAQRTDENVE